MTTIVYFGRVTAGGRVMDVHTTQPGVQFYTGYYLNVDGKSGHHYGPYSAFCLETQHYPDSPNKVSAGSDAGVSPFLTLSNLYIDCQVLLQ